MRKNTVPVVIQLENVTKKYILHHEKPTFIESMLNSARTETFTAVNNIFLDIRQGEKVGIIGLNGSGKTTLLKLIAKITQPTNGTVTTRGRVVSLIDLEAGFHPELSGEANIFLNGLLLGMSRQEIKQEMKNIITFSGLESFIDVPFYTYSQGMKLRLGFSVAIHSQPDILLIDEGYAVGDKNFTQKAKKRLNKMLNKSLTLLLVSQVPSFIAEYATKIIEIEKGTIKATGDLSLARTFFRQ
jgi:ABC-type polysaccharide/polyol phosphate transport system ATPase subunit